MRTLDQIKLELVGRNLIPGAYLRLRQQQELNRRRKDTPSPPHLLKQQVVRRYGVRSGARVFIETGTYFGFMLQACLGHFDELFSIEIERHFYRRAEKIFRNQPTVNLLFGDSAELLPILLGGVRQCCLFWLDAHYSGGLTGQAGIETPIQRELEAILRHSCRHTVLIDDANCFNGTRDYPEMAWIEKTAWAYGYSTTVSHNIIRLV